LCKGAPEIVQKYLKNEGFYIYHNDFLCNYNLQRYRLFTFIFYLNDIIEGGETEFFQGKYRIKPEAGKMIIFPSTWTYPHCGKTPLSNDKYIITGWIYCNENKYIHNKVDKLYNNCLSDLNCFENDIKHNSKDKNNIKIPK
jgi:hypothetical protein